MLIEDVLGKSSSVGSRELNTIRKQCALFLKESAGLPVYKSLPRTYNDFHRVKVRQQRHSTVMTEAFNRAFGEEFHNLHQRAIFAQAARPEIINEDTEPFYVFPINGYRYLYSKEVRNSNSDYKTVMDTLIERLDDMKAVEIITDVLKYTYVGDNLVEGIMSDSEIIFYGIPYFYAVRVASHEAYGALLSGRTAV